jgi:electron transport complex protein RnfG
MKDITRFSIVLFSICIISALLLACIFDIAEPRIQEQRRLEEKKAIQGVLPALPDTIEKVEDQDLVFYKAKDTQGNLIAYVFIAEGYGYSSDIRTVVSLTPEGNIVEAKILEQLETPGIGSQITEEDFLSQFKDKRFDAEFDTITGATISSTAVIDSIKEAAERILKYSSGL